jgi:hypothetical protein
MVKLHGSTALNTRTIVSQDLAVENPEKRLGEALYSQKSALTQSLLSPILNNSFFDRYEQLPYSINIVGKTG